jgi:hypothetical protein
MFTTSIEAAFTNVLDAVAANKAMACVCRAGHAD